ncbi:hypothetical protein [Caulobacter sp. SSI4214]|uniref:hypothetical protein n=1 Tax=Caulobacter sp. SSI4214 TaxID=2575739 RepID=UPI00143BFE5C|nr:hypothetical protein [Caulobacter sp. SSI4214]
MPWFKCFIEGENFPGALIGKSHPVGFYATRWVEASSTDEAELVALDLLRTEPIFDIPVEQRPKNARVYFTEIVETHGPGSPNAGATWYVMGA